MSGLEYKSWYCRDKENLVEEKDLSKDMLSLGNKEIDTEVLM